MGQSAHELLPVIQCHSDFQLLLSVFLCIRMQTCVDLLGQFLTLNACHTPYPGQRQNKDFFHNEG